MFCCKNGKHALAFGFDSPLSGNGIEDTVSTQHVIYNFLLVDSIARWTVEAAFLETCYISLVYS